MTERENGGPCLSGAYETVRAWVEGTTLPVARPPGLALLVRYGLPTWMHEWPVWAPAPRAVTATTPGGATSLSVASSAAAREVAVVLAAMARRSMGEG